VFQRVIDKILVKCMDLTRVYIDDILVMSGSWMEHMEYFGTMFKVLKEARMTCK